MSLQKEIKKQINSQTREKVGNIKITNEGTQFIGEPTPPWAIGRSGQYPMITWNKTSYNQDRGANINLTPYIFNNLFSMPSYQLITAPTGNFVDKSNNLYYNARFSGWAGIKGGGSIRIGMRTANSNVSVWVDGEKKFAALFEDQNETYVTVNIATKSLVEIFWYSPSAENYLTIVGDIGKDLSYWETSDNTPYARTVEWYIDDPITSDSAYMGGTPMEYVQLRWWFGEDSSEGTEELPGGVELVPLESFNVLGNDLDVGGFGIWTINFQDSGEIDVIDENTIVFYGNYPNLKYVRIKPASGTGVGEVLEVQYTETYDPITNMTTLVSEAHGLTDADDGRVIEIGILKKVQDVPMSNFTGALSDVYETMDTNILRGERYYYLIDTYDTSTNRNRGGMTATYQTIIAGDFTAPPIVQNLTATRNAVDSVTLQWDDVDARLVKQWNVYTDAYSADYTITGGTTRFVNLGADISVFETALRNRPEGVLVSIEVASGVKYVRYVIMIEAGRLVLDQDLPESVANNDTIRVMAGAGGTNNSSITIPTPPDDDYVIVDDIPDLITL